MGAPRCPNHNCELSLTRDERGKNSGSSPCPVSGAMFNWTQETKDDESKKTVDKFGNVTHDTTYKVTGEDGVGG
jgi:hypothetical protein